MGFPALADAGAAGDAWDEVSLATPADSSTEVAWKVGSGTHGDLSGEVDVSLG